MSNQIGKEELQAELEDLPGWAHANDALSKTFRFASFRDAVAFLVRLSFEAEDMQHHPEVHNVYNKLTITLRTHDAGNVVTEKDCRLAEKIESLFAVSR
jgi:4a-hydroxytetrahydrobiopterin dehydratase